VAESLADDSAKPRETTPVAEPSIESVLGNDSEPLSIGESGKTAVAVRVGCGGKEGEGVKLREIGSASDPATVGEVSGDDLARAREVGIVAEPSAPAVLGNAGEAAVAREAVKRAEPSTRAELGTGEERAAA
jgi:hypothetical protein